MTQLMPTLTTPAVPGLEVYAAYLPRSGGGDPTRKPRPGADKAALPLATARARQAVVATGTTGLAVIELTVSEDLRTAATPGCDPLLAALDVTFAASEHIHIDEPSYPASHRRPVPHDAAPPFVSGTRLAIPITIDVERGCPAGVHRVACTIRYQTCNGHVCLLPTSVEMTLAIQVVPSA